MYIDECGTDDIVSCHLPDHRYLALTGVIITHDDVATIATPGLNEIKRRYFPSTDPDASHVVLHRSDFLGAKSHFQALSDPVQMGRFQDDLHKYLADLPHKVITVAIDKQAMLKRDHGL